MTVDTHKDACVTALPVHKKIDLSLQEIEAWNHDTANICQGELILDSSMQLLEHMVKQYQVPYWGIYKILLKKCIFVVALVNHVSSIVDNV